MDSTIKTPSDTEVVITTPPPATKSFTNGVLKRHNHHYHPPQPTSAAIVVYRECLKNHAASLGGHSLDGCGEFMPSPNTNLDDPTSLKCAACNCHRNFHRRDPEEGTHIIEYRHHQAPPVLPTPQQQQPGDQEVGNVSPSSSDSPPPISSAYNYPNSSAPHMLFALRTGGLSGVPSDNNNNMMMGGKMSTTTTTTTATIGGLINSPNTNGNVSGSGRKRIRTKFSQEQKDKMYLFSESLGWRLQKRDEGIIDEFCNEVGLERGILKVWMHNNKHTFGKIRDSTTPATITSAAPHVRHTNNNNHRQNHHHHQNQPQNQNHHYNNGGGGGSVHHHNQHREVQVTAANCSSSSS